MWKIGPIPEGGEAAVAPLNDPSNVGKWAHVSWNGNSPNPQPITKVGRLNVYVGSVGLRVSADGETACTLPSANYRQVAYTVAAVGRLNAGRALQGKFRMLTSRADVEALGLERAQQIIDILESAEKEGPQ
jgi:hypothetical protein